MLEQPIANSLFPCRSGARTAWATCEREVREERFEETPAEGKLACPACADQTLSVRLLTLTAHDDTQRRT